MNPSRHAVWRFRDQDDIARLPKQAREPPGDCSLAVRVAECPAQFGDACRIGRRGVANDQDFFASGARESSSAWLTIHESS